MASPIVPVALTAPGFFGLNTQDSPTDMDTRFALDATNCVIDKSGRVASRKGWVAQNTILAALGTNNVEAIGELVDLAGNRTTICAGNNKLFKLSGTTLVELTYGGGGVAPTITANDWQIATLNNAAVFFQIGHDPLLFDVDLSSTQYRRVSEHPTYSGTVPQANCVLSAYGRLWAARTNTDKSTIQWTDTSTHQKWSGGTAGSLSLIGVWPKGGDEVVALGSHNNFLFIFGRTQILIYSGANSPATMTLYDSIVNTGCVARDSVASTGEDIIFLSDTGVRSVLRTIQEKSAPLRSVSRNVNDDIQAYTGQVISVDAKGIYSPADSFYLLTFRSSGVTYCFDMRSHLEDGSARVTLWNGISPRCLFVDRTRKLLIGKAGYIGFYNGYNDNGAAYRISYYTAWMDFGSAIKISILKKISLIFSGTQGQSVVTKWGFDYNSSTGYETIVLAANNISEYGVTEYGVGVYGSNQFTNAVSVNPGGAGKVAQIGIEALVSSGPLALQKMEVFTKEGRI